MVCRTSLAVVTVSLLGAATAFADITTPTTAPPASDLWAGGAPSPDDTRDGLVRAERAAPPTILPVPAADLTREAPEVLRVADYEAGAGRPRVSLGRSRGAPVAPLQVPEPAALLVLGGGLLALGLYRRRSS
jgi:hypothetical protein